MTRDSQNPDPATESRDEPTREPESREPAPERVDETDRDGASTGAERSERPSNAEPDGGPDAGGADADAVGADADAESAGPDDVELVDAGSTVDLGSSYDAGWIVASDERHAQDDEAAPRGQQSGADADHDPAGLDLTAQTQAGSLQDHLGMAVEPDLHRVDLPGHRAVSDGAGLPTSPAAGMAEVSMDSLLGDVSVSTGRPGQDDVEVDASDDPFGRGSGSVIGEGQPATLYDNPAVVGSNREAELLDASDPSRLTGLVDLDGIRGGQVGGTIDGRTPDGGMGGESAGFNATSGWGGGDPLAGANGLTDPFKAAKAVQDGISDFGHGGFTVYDAHTGQAVYGQGVSSGTAPSIQPGSGPPGKYITVPNGSTEGTVSASSSSTLSPPVRTSDAEGVSSTGSGTVHSDNTFFQKLASIFVQGTPGSEREKALNQATQVIDSQGASPPEEPEPPAEGPENELPADPDAGGVPPMGLDLSQEWAIQVHARETSEINPDPGAQGQLGSPATMDISGFVELHDGPEVASSVDPESMLQAQRDSIGEQFTEFDGS